MCYDGYLVYQYGLKKDSRYSVIVQTEQQYITMTEKYPIDTYTGDEREGALKYIKLTFLDAFQPMSRLSFFWVC